MSKPQLIRISIPHPCNENWDEMTPSHNGRFCAHCQKTVIDFTTWSDTALYNFFAKKDEQVCGRFCSSQLNRAITIPPQLHSRLYRIVVAMGLTFVIVQVPGVSAQNRPPLVMQTDSNKQNTALPSDGRGTLSGTVVNEKSEPMLSANVQLYKGEKLVAATITDFDGNYIMNNLVPGEYSLTAQFWGYDSIRIEHVVISTDFAKQCLTFKRPKDFKREREIIITAGRPSIIDRDNPTKATFSREDIDRRR